jgi:hypothetical protein
MDEATTVEVLNALERVSVGALTLHGLLIHEGLPHHARLAWAHHEDAAGAAETIGAELEVDVRTK